MHPSAKKRLLEALSTPDDFRFLELSVLEKRRFRKNPKLRNAFVTDFSALFFQLSTKERVTCNPHADCEEVAKSKETSAQGTLNEEKDGLILLSEASASLCALQKGAPTSLEECQGANSCISRSFEHRFSKAVKICSTSEQREVLIRGKLLGEFSSERFYVAFFYKYFL